MNGLKVSNYKKTIVGLTLILSLLLTLKNIVEYSINRVFNTGQIEIIIVNLITYTSIYIIIITAYKIKAKDYINKKINLGAISMIFIGVVINIIVNIILGIIFGSGLSKNLSLYEYIDKLIGIHSLLKYPYGIIYLGILTVIITPFFEEIVFRGFMITKIYENTNSKIISILVSSFLFGLMHFEIIGSINAFIYGVFASWVYIKYKNIKINIVMHSMINLLTLVLVFIK